MIAPASASLVFTQRFDIWSPVELPPDEANSRLVQGLRYARVGVNVKGRIVSRAEIGKPQQGIGRSNQDYIDTKDEFRCDLGLVCKETWYIQNVTPGDPTAGEWFIIQGDSKKLYRRARRQSFFITRTVAPPGVGA